MGDLKFYTTEIKYFMFKPVGDMTKDSLTLLLPGYLAGFNSPAEYENIVNGVKIIIPGAKSINESTIDHDATLEQRAILIKRSPKIMCFGGDEIMAGYASLLDIINRKDRKAKKGSVGYIKGQKADGQEEPQEEISSKSGDSDGVLETEESIHRLVEEIEKTTSERIYVKGNRDGRIEYTPWNDAIVQPDTAEDYVLGWLAAMAYLGLKTTYEAAELFRKKGVRVFEAKKEHTPKYRKCVANQTAFLLEELNRVRCAGDA